MQPASGSVLDGDTGKGRTDGIHYNHDNGAKACQDLGRIEHREMQGIS